MFIANNPIWKVGTCISPLSALNLRFRSAFTTLYSPASRKLVSGADPYDNCIMLHVHHCKPRNQTQGCDTKCDREDVVIHLELELWRK